MAEKKNPLGPTGETAAANVKRIREKQRLSYAELSRKLDELDRPIATLGLSRIENGARRIDTDDLMALAVALGVSPITLLMPDDAEYGPDAPLEVTGHPSEIPAKRLWSWLRADHPIDREPVADVAEATEAERATKREEFISWSAAALPFWRRSELSEGLVDMINLNAGGERAEAVMRKYPDVVARAVADMKRDHGDDQ